LVLLNDSNFLGNVEHSLLVVTRENTSISSSVKKVNSDLGNIRAERVGQEESSGKDKVTFKAKAASLSLKVIVLVPQILELGEAHVTVCVSQRLEAVVVIVHNGVRNILEHLVLLHIVKFSGVINVIKLPGAHGDNTLGSTLNHDADVVFAGLVCNYHSLTDG
jgi:hypothetical protein